MQLGLDPLHYRRNPSGEVQILQEILSSREEAADLRDLTADSIKEIEIQVDPRFVRDGSQMKDRVGRAPQRHVHVNGVFKGLFRHDAPRRMACLDKPHYLLSRGKGETPLAGRAGEGGGGAGERQSQHLSHASHRVCGIEALAGAGARTCLHFQALQFMGIDLARLESTDGFKGVVYEGQPAHLISARIHRSRGEHDRGNVEPRASHKHPWRNLVTVSQEYESIEAMNPGDRFDAIRNQLSRGQRIMHAGMAHCDAIADPRDPKKEGIASTRMNPLLDEPLQISHSHVSGDEITEAGGHSDKGPLQGISRKP